MTVRGAVVTGVVSTVVGLLLLPVPASEAAVPTCDGHRATIVGTGDADVLRGTRRADVIVGLGGDDSIAGRGGGDVVCGGSGDDSVQGGGGSDLLLGQDGSDVLLGQAAADTLRGGGGMDALAGMSGNDTLSGQASIDLAAFLSAPGPVTADTGTGRARGEGTDALVGVEGFIGSGYDDVLRGDDGLDVFFGSGGDDTMTGGSGSDWVFYGLAAAGVAVDLAHGTATGGEGEDSMSSVENAVGSPYDDTLLGSVADNYLDGVDGYDVVDGDAGNNLCYAEEISSCYVEIPTSSTEPTSQGALAAPTTDGPTLAGALTAVAGTRPSGAPVGSVAPEGAPPAPDRAPTSPTAFNEVSCPMLQGVAWFNLPRWDGYGYYAYRAYRPLTGYDAWTYSLWLWYGNGGWQVYYNGQWYTVPQTYAVIPGGTSLPVEVAYFYYPNQTWYSMGGCNTNAPAFGVYVE